MTTLKPRSLVAIALVLLAAGGFLATRSHSEASTTVQALAEETHFHGIAVDPSDPARLYIATHHGLYAVTPDGTAERLSPVQDFMGFTPHPTTRRSFTRAAIRLAAAILVSSRPETVASPGASSPRAWAVRSTSTRWT